MGVRIVSIEDDDVDFKMISREFKKLGFSGGIVRAKDGEAGVKLVEEESRQHKIVVLLDLRLPKLGGIEVLKKLRANPKTKNTVVFVLSTSEADSDRNQVCDLNVAGYLTKDLEGFARTIDLVCTYIDVVKLPP